MCRKYHIFWALAPFMAISLAGGEPKKLIVFDTIDCAIKSSVFSKVVCQLYSRTEFTVFLTVGEKKQADKVYGACEVKLYPKRQKKITRINNLRLDFCQLKKHSESRSVLGMGKIYANDELGLEIKLAGGYFEVANDAAYSEMESEMEMELAT
ncbi:GD11354 [Drosophila simulans]|uniref:GD11354 n=1 Tax=Drosophila simulans TaxID=7240 RepID=B4QCB5_DROSI|nr:GD11354 [Drosophila simulans]